MTLPDGVQELPVSAATGAFEAFYLMAGPDLRAYAMALTGDPQAAADVVQEALTRTYARWPILRQPKAFAVRVTHNLAIDHLRRHAREVSVADVPDSHAPEMVNSTVLDVVRRLDARHRDVILLHYILDMPVTEVAAVLRRPVGTVKRRLHEARAQLQVLIGDGHER